MNSQGVGEGASGASLHRMFVRLNHPSLTKGDRGGFYLLSPKAPPFRARMKAIL
jgi:hypothetical protein